MTKIVLLAFGLLWFLPAAAHAQSTTNQSVQGTQSSRTQSLQPTRSACSIGSQSLRVCNNGLESCNAVCTARALDPSADIAGCSTSCCNGFNECVRQRGCGDRIINCE
jgi:hypothetical protein